MRALQLSAIWAFVRIGSNQSVMCSAVIAPGLGDFILLDGHVSTSNSFLAPEARVIGGGADIFVNAVG
jgi:hypothetical protein